MKRIVTGLAITGVLLAIWGAAGLAQDKPLKKVVFAVTTKDISVGHSAHSSLPQALGYWKEEGLDVMVTSVEGSAAGMQQLAAGADVNEAMQPRKSSGKNPPKGTSALTLSVENGHFELALALVEAGADPNDQRSGFTPLHMMTWVRKPPRGEDYGAPPPLGSGNLSSVQFIRKLVEHGADVNAKLKSGKGGPGLWNKVGATPFFMACATADIACMKLLVELGANPSLRNVDNCTPLMVACGIGVGADAANEVAGEEPEVLEAAQYLLDLGADVNAVDANGETAMHGAAYKNMPKVIQFLADHGAKIEIWNRKNKYGWTPLLIAEGHRPGNFKPSAETIAAIQRLMQAAGVTPPTPATASGAVNETYSANESKKSPPRFSRR
jgi:ankyrin repeat protein